jgi:hypothetical protein
MILAACVSLAARAAFGTRGDVAGPFISWSKLMKAAKQFGGGLLAVFMVFSCPHPSAQAAIIVYDNDLDFSDVNNPSGTWSYLQGNAVLPHFTPVPHPQLALAVANGYWGASSSNLSTSIMLATANGSATGLWNDTDFISGDMLIGTTDPSAGGPTVLAWTAPSNGTLTYNGAIWYADAPNGPGGTDFSLALNAGPPLEFGTAGLAQNRPNAAQMVNGFTPVNVLAGDVLALELNAAPGPPFGRLTGVVFTIDFVPIPEPSSLVLLAFGGVALVALGSLPRGKRVSMLST